MRRSPGRFESVLHVVMVLLLMQAFLPLEVLSISV